MRPDLPPVQPSFSLPWALNKILNSNWKTASSAVACLRLWPQLALPHKTHPSVSTVAAVSDPKRTSIQSSAPSSIKALFNAQSASQQQPQAVASSSISHRHTCSISEGLEPPRAIRRYTLRTAAAHNTKTAGHSSGRPPSSKNLESWQRQLRDAFPTIALIAAAMSCGGLAVASSCGILLRTLFSYGAIEFAFQAWQRRRYASCNLCSNIAPDTTRIPLIKKRFMNLHGVIDIRKFLSGWFHGAPFEVLRHGNIQDFVAYGFYCSAFEELPPRQQIATDEFIQEVSSTWDVSFPEGFNAEVTPMTHLWEPLRVGFKPVIIHLASEICGGLTRILLCCQGYKTTKQDGFAFWIWRPPGSRSNTRGTTADTGKGPPIVFLHGVGWGLMPYLHFVSVLSRAAPSSPIVVAEVPHLAIRLTGTPRSVDDIAHATAAVLRQHGFDNGACIVGHSYGTFAVSRIRQLYPQMTHSMALLDPVCLMTCAPGLLANFVYKQPELSWRSSTSAEGLMNIARNIATRDLLIAASFCRNFHWHELMLWPEDMAGVKAVVALSFHDDLVPVNQVMAQMQQAESAHVLVHPTACHGGFLLDRRFQDEVAAAVALNLLD